MASHPAMASSKFKKSFSAATILLLVVCLSFVSARPGKGCRGFHTAFFFPTLGVDVQKLTLLGDAQFLGSGLQIAGSKPLSAGSIFYSEPVRFSSPFHKGLSKSFSTFFSFSMDASKGDGLAFVIAPSKTFHGRNGAWLGLSDHLAHTIAVEFDAFMDAEVHDPSASHVGFDLESLVSLATAEVSDGFSLKEGEKLFAWIDYDAPSKVLEVRLSRSEAERPEKPVLSHSIDLSNVWQEEMFVGFTSSTGNSPQRHILYSWSFVTRGMGMWRPGFHPGFFGPHEEHGEWRHGPRDWHHGPRDWHHGPGDWHHGPRDWHHGPGDWHHGPRDWHHGPGDWHHGHEGFPYWPGHDLPDERHPDHFRPHPAADDDAWFDGLSDVWGVVVSLLFGVVCGTAATVVALLVWCLVRRLYMCNTTEKDAGFVLGYQKLAVSESKDPDVKIDASGYQKLSTADPDAKTESV